MSIRMLTFIVMFLTIYGGAHLYVYLHINKLLVLNLKTKIIFAVFLIFMILSLFLARIIGHYYEGEFNHYFLLFSYVWMGFQFYMFVLFLIRDVLLFISKYFLPLKKILEPGMINLIFITSLSVLICIYGYFEALDIKINIIEIPTNKILEKNKVLNIAQLTDIHLGAIVGEKRLEKMIQSVKKINPDMVLITGDLIDQDVNHIDELSQYFLSLKPKYGIYSVSGNHEFYVGIDKTEIFNKKSGMKFLRNDYEVIPGVVNIIGVDDKTAESFKSAKGFALSYITKKLDKRYFTILMNHQPSGFDNAQKLGIDLQLSGHTHNGQLFPFNYIVNLFFNPVTGLHKIGDSFLYISRGTGTWGPPMRVLSEPEVTWIKIYNDK